MTATLKLRDENGNVYEIPALVGKKGERGIQGETGERGIQGETGEQGIQGKGDKGDVGEQGTQGEIGPQGTPGTNLNLKVSRQYDTYEDLPTNPDIGYMCLVGSDLYIFADNGWVNAGKLTDIDLDIYTNIDGGLFTDGIRSNHWRIRH